MNAEARTCQNCKKSFTVEAEDFDFYKKMEVPPPTWCPECRMIRRLIWRNEHKLFRRGDDSSGKEIFSLYPAAVPVRVYNQEYWRSDAWNPFEYGREYDFSRPFFEQFRDLLYAVPWPAGSSNTKVNSDYSEQADYIKNTYLVFNASYVENSAYVIRVAYVKDTFDFLDGAHVELCYDSTLVADSFRVFYSFDCIECDDVWLSKDLVGCSNCVGCAGLRKKSYCIFNKQYTKEEYAEEFKKLRLNTFSGLQAARLKAEALWRSRPVKYYRGKQMLDSVADNAMNGKNCKECWGISNGQDVRYSQMVYNDVSNSYDYSVWGMRASRMYEVMTCGDQADNLKFCFDCWPSCTDMEYSMMCRSSSHCFGCVGLKKAQYCIFNKQYTKEQYEELVPRIKKQMGEVLYRDSGGKTYGYGEFFPMSFSPFAYNETPLQDFFPLTQEQAESNGFMWREPEQKEYAITKQAGNLPDDIADAHADLLKETIGCVECGRAFRFIPMEFQFLKSQQLPLPRSCHDCRFERRKKLFYPPRFYDRTCAKCSRGIRTSYPPAAKEVVYCESCYQQEVV